MPHYVIQLDDSDPGADEFVVYSTIVDNTITEVMSAAEMLQWLQDKEYGSWLTPFDAEELGKRDDGLGVDFYRDLARWYYWHDAGFCFGKLSDEYLVLPRELWRFE